MEFYSTANWLREKLPYTPKLAIILGTGLSDMAETYPNRIVIPYEDIPGFMQSTAPSHKGNLILCKVNDYPVLFLQGRFHYYEGYKMEQVVFPIRVLAALGLDKIVVTNASGSLKKELEPGAIVNIHDHINFMGTNPLIGKNVDEQGERFPSMNELYDPIFIERMTDLARIHGIQIQKGVYIGVTGPSLETKAECSFMATIGADIVGMSTVPEVITARHCGMRVLGVSIVTNYSNLFHNLAHSQSEIRHHASVSGKQLQHLLELFISELK
jgi:purine-nucleoside phosphorylase